MIDAEVDVNGSRLHTGRVLVYDGGCILCSRAANFVASRDRRGGVWFADGSSPAGRALLAARGLSSGEADRVVLLDGADTYAGAAALLRLAAVLPLPWRLAGLLRLLPVSLLDTAYAVVARNRHRLGGGRCPLPSSSLRGRLVS